MKSTPNENVNVKNDETGGNLHKVALGRRLSQRKKCAWPSGFKANQKGEKSRGEGCRRVEMENRCRPLHQHRGERLGGLTTRRKVTRTVW